jgi:DNA invertase Pin-like site-specific DNA recombinase
MPTCVVYYRVSTKLQEDKWSLPAQRSELTALALKHNWQILKEYTEVASGKNIKDRPAINELINDIPELAPDYVCAVDQDRLSRGNDFWLLKSIFQDAGIKIATIAKIIDFDIEEEDLASDILAAAAKYERRKLATRIKRAMKERIKEGYHNTIPFGYYRENKLLYINPEEAAIVKKMFDVYIKTGSSKKVIQYFNKRGIKTRKGVEFSHSTVTRTIKNRTYIGLTSHRGTWFKGRHKPIIDKNTFDLAQVIREANYYGRKGNNYLLKGFIYCSYCGSRMSTQQNMRKYLFYKCDKTRHNCIGQYVAKEKVDEYVWNLIVKRVEELRGNIAIADVNESNPDNSGQIKKLKKKLRILETDYYVNEGIDKVRFIELRDDIKLRIIELEDHKEETFDYSQLVDIDLSDTSTMTLEEKRQIVCIMLKKVTVFPKRIKKFDYNRLSVEIR